MVTLMEFQNEFFFARAMNFNLVVRSTGIRFFQACPRFFFFLYNNLKLGNITIWVSNYGKYRGLPDFPIPTPLGCIKKKGTFFFRIQKTGLLFQQED